MKYIQRYEDKICEQIIEYIDLSINESVDFRSLWNNTINKIKNLSTESKKKILLHLIGTMLTVTTAANAYRVVANSNLDPQMSKFATEEINKIKNKEFETFKAGYNFSLSDEGREHIKGEESLKLDAYMIGDGMISIGWGHAEPVSSSRFNMGDRITAEEADSLFESDAKKIQEGINKIFKDWEKKRINVKIDQSMYDALVSIAFNTGVGGLRKSQTMKYLKRGNYKMAGESIKSLRVSKKFPGLIVRREKEAEMFLSGIDKEAQV